jgi:RNA polymerase sigma-70 factor (ECF subfamily)
MARRNASASIDPAQPRSENDLLVIENRARLLQLVSQLPGAQRYVMHARFIEQRRIRKISRQLGKSEGAVKQLQFRALQLLRNQMEGSHA